MQVTLDDVLVVLGLDAEIFVQLMTLMAVVDRFDGLLQAYSDEEANHDGGDVDEEVAPGAGGVVWRVDVEHSGSGVKGCGYRIPCLKRETWAPGGRWVDILRGCEIQVPGGSVSG